MRLIRMFFSAMVLTFLATASAQAVSVGYTLNLSGNVNVPTVKLTNDSSSDLITAFSMTIGRLDKNFDAAYLEVPPPGVFSANLVTPDANSGGGARSNIVTYDPFVGFDPGETFQFGADVDKDHSDSVENYKTVLFNNGVHPNSVITVTFSGGTILSQTLPDEGIKSSYTFSQSQSQVIPEPSTFILLGFGLLGMAGYARKRMKT